MGRIRNLEKNLPFAVIFRLFLGSFEGEGGGAFLDLGPGKHKDFLVEYIPMLQHLSRYPPSSHYSHYFLRQQLIVNSAQGGKVGDQQQTACDFYQ